MVQFAANLQVIEDERIVFWLIGAVGGFEIARSRGVIPVVSGRVLLLHWQFADCLLPTSREEFLLTALNVRRPSSLEGANKFPLIGPACFTAQVRRYNTSGRG